MTFGRCGQWFNSTIQIKRRRSQAVDNVLANSQSCKVQILARSSRICTFDVIRNVRALVTSAKKQQVGRSPNIEASFLSALFEALRLRLQSCRIEALGSAREVIRGDGVQSNPVLDFKPIRRSLIGWLWGEYSGICAWDSATVI